MDPARGGGQGASDLREQLTPTGLGYISFNTYPAGTFACGRGRRCSFTPTRLRIRSSRPGRRGFVLALGQSPFASGQIGLLKGEVQYLQGKPESYILHEYLETMNHPFYFRDFAKLSQGRVAVPRRRAAERHGGRGKLADVQGLDGSESRRSHSPGAVRRLRGAIACSGGRVCHADAKIDRTQMPVRAESMYAVAFLRQWAEGNGMSRFEHPAWRTTGDRSRSAANSADDHQPAVSQAIAFKEVLDAVPDQHRTALTRELLNCWMNGMMELYVDPPPVLAQASDKPRREPGGALSRIAEPIPDQPAGREHPGGRDAAKAGSTPRRHAHAAISSPQNSARRGRMSISLFSA